MCISLVLGVLIAVVLVAVWSLSPKGTIIPFIAVSVLCVSLSVWVGLSLQAARIRDMGFKPKPILLAMVSFNIVAFLVSKLLPGSTIGLAISAIINLAGIAFNLSLLFWPSDYDSDPVPSATYEPKRREQPAMHQHRETAAPARRQVNGARTGFGRRGLEGQ